MGVGALLKAVRKGDKEAQCSLGQCYLDGTDVQQDLEEAVYWFEKAANQGSVRAQYNLGACYELGRGVVVKDDVRALKWYRKAAGLGSAPAQYKLGHAYNLGKGVAKNEARAVELYRKAAGQGNADAQYNLGLCYDMGKGVVQDETLAVELYRKAADQGHAQAQSYLFASPMARGMAKDDLHAVELNRKAAGQENEDAQYNLGVCYNNGTGVAKDEAGAAELYTKAADQGHADALFNQGVRYYKGRGVAKDGVGAVELYRKAAGQGNADAQYNLGVCYSHGRGVAMNEKYAVELYTQAAEQGHAEAQHALGVCYANGRGVAKDGVHAMQLYHIASDNGNRDAQNELGLCYTPRPLGSTRPRSYLKVYRKASDQGHARGAQRALGFWVSRDKACATELFRTAAEQGHANKKHTPGVHYTTGTRVAMDEVTMDEGCAAEIYRKAADQGYAGAEQALSPLQTAAKGKTDPHDEAQPKENPMNAGQSNTVDARQEEGQDTAASVGAFMPAASVPRSEQLAKLGLRLAELEKQGASRCNLVLTNVQLGYLGRMLGREGHLEGVENEGKAIVKDPRTLLYYHGLQQALCWMFAGSQACMSGLIVKDHGIVTSGLIKASSKLASLLPVVGQIVQGIVEITGEQIAAYFEGKNAERIARAGGTNGGLVAEGVARYLVFARKGKLLGLPQGPLAASDEAVSKIIREDVEKIMKWVKSQTDLSSIREASDLTGERVVQKLVEVAEPSWAQTVKIPLKPAALGASSGGSVIVAAAEVVTTPVSSPQGPAIGVVVQQNAAAGGVISAGLADVEGLRKKLEDLERSHQAQLRRLEGEVTRLRRAMPDAGAGDGSDGSMLQLVQQDDTGASRGFVKRVGDHEQQLQVHQAAIFGIQAVLGANGQSIQLVGAHVKTERWFDK